MPTIERSLRDRSMIVALCAVILAAVGVGVWLWWPKEKKSHAAAGPTGPSWYKCQACGKTFPLTPEEFVKQKPDPAVVQHDRTRARQPHCPKCGAKHAGQLMMTCRACGKHYLPEDAKNGTCPYCGAKP